MNLRTKEKKICISTKKICFFIKNKRGNLLYLMLKITVKNQSDPANLKKKIHGNKFYLMTNLNFKIFVSNFI